MAMLDNPTPAGYDDDENPYVREPVTFLGQPVNFGKFRVLVGWVVLNIAVAQLARTAVPIATVISALSMLLIIVVAIRCTTLTTLVCAMSYAATADILWRMTRAKTPWEGGKYLVIIVVLIGFYRFVGKPRNIALPTIYFLLLLPAVPAAFYFFSAGQARSQISFTLAAPLVIALGWAFFSQIRCQWVSVHRVLWTMVGPICAVASLATKATASLDAASFSSAQSNDVAAGHYGANQVSDVLGLGLLLVLMLALQDRNWANRVLGLALGIWFFAQSALTLSRGGLFTCGVAVLVAAPNILAHRRLGLRFVMALSIGALLVVAVIFPRLDQFTGGAVSKRSQDTNSTQRSGLFDDDIAAFRSHPWLGVGVGVSDYLHNEFGRHVAVASHTEQARMVAEHGVLGLIALLAMIGMIIVSYLRQTSWFGRAWVVALAAWSMVAMTHSATRIAAIPFIFALSALTIEEDAEERGMTFGERRALRKAQATYYGENPFARRPGYAHR
jgi:O-antigen ligase